MNPTSRQNDGALGREEGEELRAVRAADGTVRRLYWATYPFTRVPEVFGTGPSEGRAR
jgi:hypothetical protein